MKRIIEVVTLAIGFVSCAAILVITIRGTFGG